FNADVTIDLETSGTFQVWGSAHFTTNSAVLGDQNFALSAGVDFGSGSSSAGLTFTNAQLTEFNVGISTGFTLGGVQVQATGVNVSYDSSINQLAIEGNVSLSLEGYTFSVGLNGPNGGPGLTIDPNTGEAQFDGLQLGISNFNLGAFSINNA